MTTTGGSCPSCGAGALRQFHRVSNMPSQSARIFATRDAAMSVPRGDITLAHCDECQFITNTSFDMRLNDYSEGYEGTQAYSSVFNAFHRDLAKDLIDDYGLRGKTAVEIGCGNGEFLMLLHKLGGMRGIGYDPSYGDSSITQPSKGQVVIRPQMFSFETADRQADLYACKMTLEHISDVGTFVADVSKVAKSSADPVVYFLVPNARKILQDVAFWDVYYEHCSYFTAGSLRSLFARQGLSVQRLHTAYDDQYLSIECGLSPAANSANGAGPVDDTQALVRRYREAFPQAVGHWKDLLDSYTAASKTVAVWGAGSKAVGFLAAIDRPHQIDFAVDVNPHKRGTFLAGTGHEILGPQDLVGRTPDAVIVMNPIYRDEIKDQLDGLGLAPDLHALDPLHQEFVQ